MDDEKEKANIQNHHNDAGLAPPTPPYNVRREKVAGTPFSFPTPPAGLQTPDLHHGWFPLRNFNCPPTIRGPPVVFDQAEVHHSTPAMVHQNGGRVHSIGWLKNGHFELLGLANRLGLDGSQIVSDLHGSQNVSDLHGSENVPGVSWPSKRVGFVMALRSWRAFMAFKTLPKSCRNFQGSQIVSDLMLNSVKYIYMYIYTCVYMYIYIHMYICIYL